MQVVFCKTRADPVHYRSYTDFWRLVELAGFPWIWLDQLEPGREAVYIVTPKNGELPAILPRLVNEDTRCRFAWWCLERPDRNGSVLGGAPLPDGIDEVWMSDLQQARLDGFPGNRQVRFVPVGSHRKLAEVDGPLRKRGDGYEYDWCHMSYANPRRQAIYKRMPGHMGPNAWDDERHRILNSTRVMVNVHQDDWPVIEPLRFALAGAYKMPVVSEWVAESWPIRHRVHAVFYRVLDDLPLLPYQTPTFQELLEKWGQGLHRLLCEQFTFENCVNSAAQEMWDATD